MKNQRTAAVLVLYNGNLWLPPNLPHDTRMVLTSATASLLLYDKLHDPGSPLEPNP